MSAPAGWHPDPESQGVLRYWDGQVWTNHRAPAPQQQYAQPTQTVSSGVEIIGLLTAVFLPIIGLLVGLFCLGKSSAAGWMIGLSVASFVVYFWMFSGGSY